LIVKYSATICASDSVAALTMIKPNKYPKLFSIVFGEGMINDAVAIILFKVVGGIFDQETHQNTGVLLANILWKFIVNIVASLAIGTACGKFLLILALLCSKIFQMSRFLSHNPVA
jgi:sodium/hydrogen exchanger-like protein 6/7/sodium/hydrogen exchanger 8